MANTTNFGWETPDDTDLVKDGALAMRTLGNAIDTSLVDLKGGTTGQNLRKNTNTDMDFVWAGDATNTVIDAEGDLLVGDSADTLQRLAIGTTGQVLTVDTTIDGKIKWAAPSSGFTKISRTTLGADTATWTFDNVFTSTYGSYLVVIENIYGSSATADLYTRWRYGSTTETGTYYGRVVMTTSSGTATGVDWNATGYNVLAQEVGSSTEPNRGWFYAEGVGSVSEQPSMSGMMTNASAPRFGHFFGTALSLRTYTGFEFTAATGNIGSGSIVSIYGLAK